MSLVRRFPATLLFALLLFCPGAFSQSISQSNHLQPSLVADTTTVVAGQPFTVGVLFKIDPHWHIYWQHPGESGAAPKVEWRLPGGFDVGPLQWPLPKLHDAEDLHTNIYEQEVLLTAKVTPPKDLLKGPVSLKANLTWFICAQFCTQGKGGVSLDLQAGEKVAPANQELFQHWQAEMPKSDPAFKTSWKNEDGKAWQVSLTGLPATAKIEFFPLPPGGGSAGHIAFAEPDPSGMRTLTIPIETAPEADGLWRGLLVANEGSRRTGWYIAQDGSVGAAAAPSIVQPPASVSSTAAKVPLLPPPQTLWSVLFLAFVGGLILNVMPCVLPVISLKIFGFVKQAGEHPGRVFRLGLAFVAGVFTFFLGLATIAAVLHASGRSLSWGSQFQNPFLLTALIVLTFVFGLNLLGVFEITLGGDTTSKLSELSSRKGYGGAFLHGLFTTLLGTSCTAPFLAGSIGYAVTQPAPIIFLLFSVVAAGMSLPYFLLTAFPAWMKFLPKPGMWMERFKQVMGFIMIAVAVWLFSILAGGRPASATLVSWYLLVVAFGCWMLGAFRQGGLRWLLFPTLLVGGYFGLVHGSLKAPLATKASGLDGRIAEALKTGNPVFVDFTAEWCWNCKVFERVLHSEGVKSAFSERKVQTVVADWTHPDPEIEAWLQRFGRAGVPLYLLYKPGISEPVVMDSLTQGNLLKELGDTAPSKSSASR